MDITLILIQLSTEGILFYEAFDNDTHDWQDGFHLLFYLLPSLLEVVFSLLLVVSAYYITIWLRKSSGKKHNTCLLAWHIVNLFILTIIIALYAIFINKANSFDEDDKDYWKYQFYKDASDLANLNVEFYVDLFLLWLLHRFMKP